MAMTLRGSIAEAASAANIYITLRVLFEIYMVFENI